MVSEEADRPSTRRLVAHAALLWVGLLALMPIIGVDRAPLISDEGALLMQLETFERYDSWWAPYPLRELDPEGEWVALGDAVHDDGRIIVYTSRPVYVGVNAAAHRLAGIWGVTVLAVTAGAATALICGLLARDIRRDAGVPTIWLVGVGTPVLFHAYVLQGHTIGTLCAAAALWCLGRAATRPRPWVYAGGLIGALVVGSAVRRELAAVALGIAVWGAADWWQRRDSRPLMLAGLAMAGSVSGLALDRLLIAWATGPVALPHVPVVTSETGPLVMGRVQASYDATLLTTFGDPTVVDVLLLIGLATVVVGAIQVRRRDDPTLLVIGLGAGATAAILKIVVSGNLPPLVPGLFVAAPALLGGVLLVPKDALRDEQTRTVAVVTGVSLLGLFATQYSLGWGWGARFLLVAVPSLSVLSAIGWLHTPAVTSNRSMLRAAVTLSVLALAALAIGAQRDGRLSSEEMRDRILEAAGPDTVVVTTELWLGRYDTDQLDPGGQLWAWAPETELETLLEHLADRDIGRIVLPAWEGRDITAIADAAGWTARDPSPLPRLRVPLTLWLLVPTRITG